MLMFCWCLKLGAPCRWLVGHRLDTKSNLSPISVQTLSNLTSLTSRKVQGMSSPCPKLSKVCRVPVQLKGSWKEIGHGNSGFVQTLHCTIRTHEKIQFLTLDKVQTNTGLGTNFGQGSYFIALPKLFFNYWTNFGHGHTLDKVWIQHLLPCSNIVQTLSRWKINLDDITWTYFGCGQKLDLCSP